MYSTATPLHVQCEDGTFSVIESQEGARQGDSMGSLFYCYGIRPLLLKVLSKTVLPSVSLLAYIDDIKIVGPPCELAAALQIF
jgi:hypothetical protein